MVDADAVFEDSQMARLHWCSQADNANPNYSYTLVGGTWTARREGISYNRFEASCRGEYVSTWNARRGLPRCGSYAIKTYGLGACRTLAAAWCHCMQYFFDRAHAGSAEVFGQEAVAESAEPDDLVELLRLPSADLQKRIRDHRNCLPERPSSSSGSGGNRSE